MNPELKEQLKFISEQCRVLGTKFEIASNDEKVAHDKRILDAQTALIFLHLANVFQDTILQ